MFIACMYNRDYGHGVIIITFHGITRKVENRLYPGTEKYFMTLINREDVRSSLLLSLKKTFKTFHNSKPLV